MRFLLTFVLFVIVHWGFVVSESREKRYLLYSEHGSKLQLIFGTGLPIHIHEISAAVGWVLKSAYLVPTNSSHYIDPLEQLNKRSINLPMSRYHLYRIVEDRLLRYHSSRKGWGKGGDEGRQCLLRGICEAASLPFRSAGLVGKLLSIFFLPSTTDEIPQAKEDNLYKEAENHGIRGIENCSILYPHCNFHILDLLTVVL